MKKKMTTHLVVISAISYTYLQQKKQNTPQSSIIQNSRNLCKLCQKKSKQIHNAHHSSLIKKSRFLCRSHRIQENLVFSKLCTKKMGEEKLKTHLRVTSSKTDFTRSKRM